MFHYRLCFRKYADGPVVGTEDIVARDDVEAVRVASAHVGKQALELWCDKRRVKAFPPRDEGQQAFAG